MVVELIESASSLKTHIIEPFLTVIPQKKLSNPLAVKLLNAVLLKAQFKVRIWLTFFRLQTEMVV